jgi:hypothetical protein
MAKRKGAQVLSGVYLVLQPGIPIAKISPLNNIHSLPKSPQYFRPCASKVFWIFQYLPHYIILKAEKIWTVVYKSQIPKPIYQRNRGNGLLERPPKTKWDRRLVRANVESHIEKRSTILQGNKKSRIHAGRRDQTLYCSRFCQVCMTNLMEGEFCDSKKFTTYLILIFWSCIILYLLLWWFICF